MKRIKIFIVTAEPIEVHALSADGAIEAAKMKLADDDFQHLWTAEIFQQEEDNGKP